MLKISSYLTISAFFLLTFVLFMAFNPGLYDAGSAALPEFSIERLASTSPTASPASAAYAVIGNGEAADTARLALDALCLGYRSFATLSDFDERDEMVRCAIIASPEGDVSPLSSFVAGGGSAILCAMPSGNDWLALSGVSWRIGASVEGFEIYEGLLLGGTFEAEDWSFDCEYVTLANSCKVFANGYSPDRDRSILPVPREMKLPLIWRNRDGGGDVFTINAPWVRDMAGVGIISGIISAIEEDLIYPVVGTKTVILDGFPDTDNDSGEGNRTAYAFSRDIVFPDLVSISKHFRLTYTCLAKGSDSGLLAPDIYKQTGGEIGTRAVFGEPNGTIFGWSDSKTAILPTTSSGVGDERESLNFIGAMSAAGFALHRMDMSSSAGVSDGEWNLYALEISKYFSYLFKNTGFMRAETATYAHEAVKNYLNSDVAIDYGNNRVSVELHNNSAPLLFILRTDKRIASAENCEYEQLEDGAYLVTTSGSFTLMLETEGVATPFRAIEIPQFSPPILPFDLFGPPASVFGFLHHNALLSHNLREVRR